MKRIYIPFFVLLMIFSLIPALAQEVSFDDVAAQTKQDSAVPAITSVQITPASTQVRIIWETAKPAISYIEYGQTPAYGSRNPEADAGLTATQSHSVVISNLSEFRTYHFRIRAHFDHSTQEAFSRPLTFTTLQAGSFSDTSLFPTPADFSSPIIQSLAVDGKDGISGNAVIQTDEASILRFEYGAYIKGAPFLFEGKEVSKDRATNQALHFSGISPSTVYVYRLTAQDLYGNKGIYYGTFQTGDGIKENPVQNSVQKIIPKKNETPPVQVKPADKKQETSQSIVPPNSVLVTRPDQLKGIPASDLWRDPKSGRLYRVFHSMPQGAVLLTSSSQLKGLNPFQIWKDLKTGRLYKHAGIPNPENSKKEAVQNLKKEDRPIYIPKQWIRITSPIQLQILRAWEVWHDKKTNILYRIIK